MADDDDPQIDSRVGKGARRRTEPMIQASEKRTGHSTAQGPSVSKSAARMVASRLLDWYANHGRTFRWRQRCEPFHVLVAEILLKKTGAKVVEAYLPAFIAAYPTAQAVAGSSLETLTATLAPLGLGHQRAQQLLDLAREIVATSDGVVPKTAGQMQLLPGVGRYTAGIVASTCFGEAVPAVDTNVARVISRVFGITPSHAEARKSTNIWQAAAMVVESGSPAGARVTWAMLDLGATICTARKPNHAICPLRAVCRSANEHH